MLGIYLIICEKNKRVYVGRSKDIEKRIKRHFKSLEKQNHHNCKLQRDYDKYGRKAFIVKYKKLKSVEQCKKKEQKLIDTVPNQYNINASSTCGDLITRHPDRENILLRRYETHRKNMRKMSAEERRKYGSPGELNGMYGKTHSKRVRKLLSELHKGNKYCLGLVRSPEQKKLLSELAKQRTGEKNGFWGKCHSKETKRRISEANRGKLPTNSLKVKVGDKVYPSASQAAKAIGCATASIRNRIENPKFPEYSYV